MFSYCSNYEYKSICSHILIILIAYRSLYKGVCYLQNSVRNKGRTLIFIRQMSYPKSPCKIHTTSSFYCISKAPSDVTPSGMQGRPQLAVAGHPLRNTENFVTLYASKLREERHPEKKTLSGGPVPSCTLN